MQLRMLSLAAAAALSAGCDLADPASSDDGVEIRALIVRMLPGDSVRLEPGGGAAWSSSAPAVASVDEDGVVDARSPGWSTIVASAGGRSDTVYVAVGLRFVGLTAGSHHTCGWTAEGGAWCWGENSGGALGDGTRQSSAVPVAVSGSRRFARLSAGSSGTCGITFDARLLCWGRGGRGELGIHPAPDDCRGSPCSLVPVEPVPGARFRDVARGGLFGSDHVCASRSDGVVYCWGENFEGQLGAEADSCPFGPWCSVEPLEVTALAGIVVVDIVAGGEHTCVLTGERDVWCWGDNDAGQLGRSGDPRMPAAVTTVGFEQLFAGLQHSCGLAADGTAWCWGANVVGQLGHGAGEPCDRFGGGGMADRCVLAPAPVPDGRFSTLAAGWDHTCGAALEAPALCWGAGAEGALGNGGTASSTQPAPLANGLVLVSIAAGFSHSCGLTPAGAALCWGSGGHTLGTGIPGARRTVPVHVAPPGPLPAAFAAAGL